MAGKTANKRIAKPPAASARRGEAGRQGDDVRSDLFVAIEQQPGGIVLDVASRVDPYYGESIRAQIGACLRAAGVKDARVQVRDQGGLPFVIQSRLEAALLRAGLGDARAARPPRAAALPQPSARDRMRRSRLYLPGNEPKYMLNAGLHAPDGIILDLEDSVHPAEKDAARLLAANALRAVDFGGAERMVRINQLPLGLEDLEEIMPESPDLILIPKVEGAGQVDQVDRAIKRLRPKGKDRPVWLMPILESALGIENAFAIARACEQVVGLALGLEDLTADLGVVKTREGDESLYARLRVVNAAHAAGVQAIDSVYGDVADEEGLRAWAVRSRGLGFEGMGCVHPRQIKTIHAAFAPTPDEIARALAIEAAFARARESGSGVVSLGAKMIDPPVVERARRLLARARRMRLVPDAGDAREASGT